MEALAEEQRCEQHDPRWPGSRRGHAYQRHRTRSMLDRYSIIREQEIAAGLEKTAAYVDALPSTTNIVPLRVERNASR